MAITHGMNIEQVRSDAKKLETYATTIQTTADSANKLVTGSIATNWQGPDSKRFVGTTWPSHYKSLKAAAEALRGVATTLKAEASAQQSTSA
ncbi:MAG: hypothetical protein LBK54_01455 [Propionibacteriaceae bacterium]|jgi:uncharacterized protein YukE|nr:hypothetical protein [Propionibacteriaceae bacterium]